MKKTFALLMALTLALLVVGCSKTKDVVTSEPTEKTYEHGAINPADIPTYPTEEWIEAPYEPDDSILTIEVLRSLTSEELETRINSIDENSTHDEDQLLVYYYNQVDALDGDLKEYLEKRLSREQLHQKLLTALEDGRINANADRLIEKFTVIYELNIRNQSKMDWGLI